MAFNKYTKIAAAIVGICGLIEYFIHNCKNNLAKAVNQTEDYRYYIMVRDYFGTRGFQVNWDDNKNVIMKKNSHVIILPVNSKLAYVDTNTVQMQKSHPVIEGKMLMAPSSYNKIMAALQSGNEARSIEELWNDTVAVHLQDELWPDENIYDVGHYLMVPMHTAFVLDEAEWQE
ncbi:MAG: stalk domain-containing protein [Syntrophomonas sp.]